MEGGGLREGGAGRFSPDDRCRIAGGGEYEIVSGGHDRPNLRRVSTGEAARGGSSDAHRRSVQTTRPTVCTAWRGS